MGLLQKKKNSYTSKNITVRPVLKTRQLEKRKEKEEFSEEKVIKKKKKRSDL
jgi:hypothetical protein